MSVSAIRPIQGQQIAWPPQAGRKTDSPRLADRNAGPDTVSISPEALALSKTARADTSDTLVREVADEGAAFAESLSVLPRQLAAAGSATSATSPARWPVQRWTPRQPPWTAVPLAESSGGNSSEP